MGTGARIAAIGLTGLALLAGLVACSNDVTMPSNYHDGRLAAPDQVHSTATAGAVTVTWQMSSRDNVTGFIVSFADTTGESVTRFVDDPGVSTYTDTDLGPTAGEVWIVRLWAVDALGFYGASSTPDTLRVP